MPVGEGFEISEDVDMDEIEKMLKKESKTRLSEGKRSGSFEHKDIKSLRSPSRSGSMENVGDFDGSVVHPNPRESRVLRFIGKSNPLNESRFFLLYLLLYYYSYC